MNYTWKSDTATAAAVYFAGWTTEEEHAIWLAAQQHMKNVARLHYALAAREIKCPTCGHSKNDG